MPYSPADKRRVFLAYRAIFVREKALIRRHKKVLDLVNLHTSSFGPLIRDFGIGKIVDILRVLLLAGIFRSELKAKVEFPELFRSSPIREVQRAASENDAARSESQALEEIESLEGRGNESDEKVDEQPTREVSQGVEVGFGPSAPIQSLSDSQPSLYPFYLPFKVQHVILTTTQRILEECCFDFVRKWLPSVLEEHGWDCAAAVELMKWTRILERHSTDLPMQTLDLKGSSLDQIFLSANRLRHTAVHRLPTTARGIDQLIQSALRLTEALNDHLRTAQLEELHHEIISKIEAMELNKNLLEDELNAQLQGIQQQRAELDRREKDAKATVLRQDIENRTLIGFLLEEAVQKIFDEELTPRADLEKDQDQSEARIDEEEMSGS